MGIATWPNTSVTLNVHLSDLSHEHVEDLPDVFLSVSHEYSSGSLKSMLGGGDGDGGEGVGEAGGHVDGVVIVGYSTFFELL
tara:strand:- start:339 stop:584 length:246 start_codon:yes stop_codon:yes gene_type:complete